MSIFLYDFLLTCDVCVVGGGYTGLSTALSLSEKGYSVVLLEAQRVAFGASGRNGGCMIPQSTKFQGIKEIVGLKDAKYIVMATEAAVNIIKDYCKKNNIDAQIRDDEKQSTLLASSSLDKELKKKVGDKTGNIKTATAVGSDIAKKAKEKGIKVVYFDRGGYLYHGRVKALAEAARKEGLKF